MSISHQASFDVAAGSIPGKAHVAAGRNNQDAAAWRQAGRAVVAVVCDGCSSGAYNELGARIGAELFATELAGEALQAPRWEDAAVWERVTDTVLAQLDQLVTRLGGERPAQVEAGFLFTVVGVVATPDVVWLFSAGDGVVVIDGVVRTLGPFANNAPPYLGYRLLGGRTCLSVERIDVRHTLLLGTDGACDVPELPRLASDDAVFRNPDVLRRRLAVLARAGVTLHDDTTLIALRRRTEA